MPPIKPPLKKTPPVFGKEEPSEGWKRFIPWSIVGAGVVAIALMIYFNPKQKHLICQNVAGRSSSLISFGTCSEEQPN